MITGVGLVTPLGHGNESVWRALIAGKCCEPTLFNHQQYDQHSVTTTNTGSLSVVSFVKRPDDAPAKKGSMPRFIEFALAASDLAIQHSSTNSNIFDFHNLDRAGVCIGTGGIGSLDEIITSDKKFEQSFKKLSPYFVPNTLVNMAAGRVSMRYVYIGVYRGVYRVYRGMCHTQNPCKQTNCYC